MSRPARRQLLKQWLLPLLIVFLILRFTGTVKVESFFAWYDLWVGGFYDRKSKTLYICPVPMCVIKLSKIKE